MTVTPPAAIPAALGLRLIAAVYDLLPLLALWFFACVAALAIRAGALDVHRLGDKIIVQALVLVASALYFVASWVRGGQTVGMRPWRLRVVAADGTALGWGRAALRFGAALISLGAFGLGFLWCLVDAKRRAWHDILAGTVLVQLEKTSRA
jgi:uncharacterized RDD family membrane protein YckC